MVQCRVAPLFAGRLSAGRQYAGLHMLNAGRKVVTDEGRETDFRWWSCRKVECDGGRSDSACRDGLAIDALPLISGLQRDGETCSPSCFGSL